MIFILKILFIMIGLAVLGFAILAGISGLLVLVNNLTGHRLYKPKGFE